MASRCVFANSVPASQSLSYFSSKKSLLGYSQSSCFPNVGSWNCDMLRVFVAWSRWYALVGSVAGSSAGWLAEGIDRKINRNQPSTENMTASNLLWQQKCSPIYYGIVDLFDCVSTSNIQPNWRQLTFNPFFVVLRNWWFPMQEMPLSVPRPLRLTLGQVWMPAQRWKSFVPWSASRPSAWRCRA